MPYVEKLLQDAITLFFNSEILEMVKGEGTGQSFLETER